MTQAFNLSQFANRLNTTGQLNPASAFSAPMPVNQGGTSLSTLTVNGILIGNGTSALQFVLPSTSGNVLTSDGTNWTSAANKYIGVNQTWQSVTATRTLGTAYTNTTGRPILVSYSYVGQSTSTTVTIEIDNTGSGTWVTIARMRAQNQDDINGDAFSFIVPNGASYRITSSGTPQTVFWSELRA